MKLKKLCVILLDVYYTRKGFHRGFGAKWLKDAVFYFIKSDLPVSKRIWAFKRGFYAYRITQYSLDKNNYKSIISDKDFMKLFPINNRYTSLIDDKLTFKYVLKPFDEYLPKYYYHILKNRGILKIFDCDEKYSNDIDGLINLVKDLKLVALKLTFGEKGVGFYKIEYNNDTYLVNNEEYNEQQFKQFILSLDDYIVTEYVQNHSELKELNPYSVNTLRISMINENGDNPEIPFAFMRIGTKKSGSVDNASQGGMFCKVDVNTGRYFDGETAFEHKIVSVANHPDTGKPIEGILPHWDLVKQKIVEVSKYLPELKWLGFDVAITEDSFVFIEINSHQGLHKAHMYPKRVTEFLQSEAASKK